MVFKRKKSAMTSNAQSITKKSNTKWGQQTSHVLFTHNVSASPFSYAHLKLVADGPQDLCLDNLMVRSYCTSALKQFLGLTGQAIPVDILKAQDTTCWIRTPREDMSSFAAAITAYKGNSEGDTRYILRMEGCSDFLGVLVGEDGQQELWES